MASKESVLLGSYAARSCAVKTQNAYDATVPKTAWEPEDSLAELFEGGLHFEAEVLDLFAATFLGRVADLRPLATVPLADRTRACLDAMSAGVEVILRGWLPVDPEGHRVGYPDALVRGADQPDGRPGYHPVEVKWHKIIERRPNLDRGAAFVDAPRPPAVLAYTTLDSPRPMPAREAVGYGVRVASREGDLLQLAHYHRLLQSAGFASAEHALAAVIGTDDTFGQRVLAWVDLSQPVVRTFSRTHPGGWRFRSLLERYQHEHTFRVHVATTAQRQTGHPGIDPPPLVRPIVTTECGRCQWWEHCLPQLDPGDVSLRIDKGPLDVREIATLRRHGISTITDLAGADLDALLLSYLPEVTHRSGAESRLKIATRRARMMIGGVPFERETTGPIDVPAAEIEIDFDVETSTNGRVYLWGFLMHHRSSPGVSRYQQFSRFDADLDSETELELASEALGWLRGLVESAETVRVYHYSAYEVTTIRTLASRAHAGLFDWALGYAEAQFVDLLDIVKAHFFGVEGLGLKSVAQQAAGFRWRDDDPGGLNSQRWFAEAVHGETPDVRTLARQRVLEYNEDDVIATSRVRAWLRAC